MSDTNRLASRGRAERVGIHYNHRQSLKGKRRHDHLEVALCHHTGIFRGGSSNQTVRHGIVSCEAEREPHHRSRRPSGPCLYHRSRGCAWTKPLEIAGLKSKDDAAAGFSEIDGNRASEHSSRVDTMDHDDKSFIRTQGASTMKDQNFVSGEGTWSFAGGTGKLKGLKGKGTYKCKPEGDNVHCDIEGEYTLPAKQQGRYFSANSPYTS